MHTKYGSQRREPIEETEYRVHIHDGDEVVLDDGGDRFEVWFRNDYHAGYTIEINGIGYEFARSYPKEAGHTKHR